MNISEKDRKTIERIHSQQAQNHWVRWLGLFAGALLCVLYWRAPVELVQWVYSGSSKSSEFPEAKYVTMFLLGLYFLLSTLLAWRGGWRERLILKLARECGVLKENEA